MMEEDLEEEEDWTNEYAGNAHDNNRLNF